MILNSFCGDVCLASDKCKNMKELEHTFVDAYRYYVGRKPRQEIVNKFLKTKESRAMNGLDYYFCY